MSETLVYLLDDDTEIVNLLSEMVELVGLNTQHFTHASHFFEQFTEFESGSVLVLDLKMPDMDGIEVMRRLSKIPNPPAIILFSGTDVGVLHSAEKLARAHNLDIIASLSKPLQLNKLPQILKQYALDKRINRNEVSKLSCEYFTPDELQEAIDNNELVLHYQPQIDISSETIMGIEALVRWQHPKHGLIYPDQFIHLIEQYGLMGDLTQWLINSIVQQDKQWRKHNLKLVISANISASNITSLILPEQIAGLLADNELDPNRLVLEVTESALMGELVTSLDILTRLRLKGIGLSIDDFGTGYSSLSQLHRIPFSELKIDRSFVLRMLDDNEARAIVKTCILLGHELNMRVVAEGVETQTHFEQLQYLGCDVAQGYFFSRAVAGNEIVNMINKQYADSKPSLKSSA